MHRIYRCLYLAAFSVMRGWSFEIGTGTLRYDDFVSDDDALRHLQRCLQQNLTILDTADVYGWHHDGKGRSNERLGRVFERKPGLRERFRLIAKLGIRLNPYRVDVSPRWINEVLQIYLDTLHTSYVDVLMIHNPPSDASLLIKTADHFSGLFQEGKVKSFGVSNFAPEQFDLIDSSLRAHGLRVEFVEMELSVLHPDHARPEGWLEHYRNRDVTILAWGPLGGEPNGRGNLLFEPGRDPNAAGALKFLDNHRTEQRPEDTTAVAWVLSQGPRVVPLLGTTDAGRLLRQARAVPDPLLVNVFPPNE